MHLSNKKIKLLTILCIMLLMISSLLLLWRTSITIKLFEEFSTASPTHEEAKAASMNLAVTLAFSRIVAVFNIFLILIYLYLINLRKKIAVSP